MLTKGFNFFCPNSAIDIITVFLLIVSIISTQTYKGLFGIHHAVYWMGVLVGQLVASTF